MEMAKNFEADKKTGRHSLSEAEKVRDRSRKCPSLKPVSPRNEYQSPTQL